LPEGTTRYNLHRSQDQKSRALESLTFRQILWNGPVIGLVAWKTTLELVSPARSSTPPPRDLAQHLDGCQLCGSEPVAMACDVPHILFEFES
ncbi:MAG: hypothetical protein ABI557_12330, partial [Aureliella sp.]